MGEDRLRGLEQGQVPVLLVHGYGCNRGCWWWLRSRLQRAGLAVGTVNLEPLYGNIDDYVDQIHRRIEAICGETGSAKVALVGHSMGGLACRAYLARHGAERAERLITLGTPHHGSELARYGLGQNARQMERGSAWLRALDDMDLPEGLPAIACYSVHDNFVMPQDSQYLENADNRPMVGIAHLEMLFSAHIATALVAALA
jgi:triacylglycerol lipase